MASISIGKQSQLPEPDQTLANYFENLLSDNSNKNLRNKIGVVDSTRQITFGQLNEQANQIARCLIKELKVENEETNLPTLVAVRFEPGTFMMWILLK